MKKNIYALTAIVFILIVAASNNLLADSDAYTIVFESDRNSEHGLYRIDKMGTNFLIEGGMPTVSLDGRNIVFVAYDFNKSLREYKLRLAIFDTISKRVSYIDTKEIALSIIAPPKFSPDSKSILFVANFKGECDNAFIKDLITGDIKQITEYTTKDNPFIQGIDWMPSGNGIVYKNRGEGIVYFDTKTKKSDLFIDAKKFAVGEFAISKNNEDIAFSGNGAITNKSVQNKQSELFIFNIKTKKISQLTYNKFEERYPTWDPTGRHICYTSFRHGNPIVGGELYIMDLETKKEHRITKAKPKGVASSFSGLINDIYPSWVE